VENPTAATAGRAADAMAARQWRCSPRFRADAHKYTITYELCSIRMVRTKNCARRTSHGLAPPSSARNSRAPLAAGFEEGQAAAVVVQVCHAGSAAAPITCTMSHHVQDGGQQRIRIRFVRAVAQVILQAQLPPQTPALCHTMCRTVGNKQLQRVIKSVMQAQHLPRLSLGHVRLFCVLLPNCGVAVK